MPFKSQEKFEKETPKNKKIPYQKTSGLNRQRATLKKMAQTFSMWTRSRSRPVVPIK